MVSPVIPSTFPFRERARECRDPSVLGRRFLNPSQSSKRTASSNMAKPVGDDVLKLGSFQYIHVLDTNLNTSKVEVGPKTFTRLEHEKGMHLRSAL